MNSVNMVGRLATEPDLKYMPSGVPVVTFRLAVKKQFKNKEGNYDVDFFDVQAWRNSAEFAANYLNKGRLIAISGRLEVNKWVAQDGSKRSIYRVVADNIETLDKKPNEEGQSAPPAKRESKSAAPATEPAAAAEEEEDFDPFAGVD